MCRWPPNVTHVQADPVRDDQSLTLLPREGHGEERLYCLLDWRLVEDLELRIPSRNEQLRIYKFQQNS